MKPNQFLSKTLFLAFIFNTVLAFPVFAAGDPREISGNIRDALTSDALPGVTVMVKGSYTGATTNADGDFVLKNVPPDNCILEISYISYKSIELPLPEGAVEPLAILLESDGISMGEVIVVGLRRNDTEAGVVGTVKTSTQVVSGMSATQIAKSADRDASEVVKRIPGITVVDERFINVRGLSQRYNNAWIDGLPVPSTETDSRAFSFDLIPSAQIDNILVYKSPSPEIPGDFSGGFVKITTKGISDENTTEFSYTTGINVKTHFNDFYFNPGSRTDFLGFDLNKRPLGKSFPSHLGGVADQAEITRLTKHGFNNDWRISKANPLPDIRFSFSMGRRFETRNGKRTGNVTAVNYSNTNKGTEGILNARYGIYSADADKPIFLDRYTDNQYSNDVRVGVMHNWHFELSPSSSIEFKNLVNILGRNRLTLRTGLKDMSSPYYREQTEMLYSSRLTYTGQVSGFHRLKTHDRTLAWGAGYSYANKNEPDRRIVTSQTGIADPADVPLVVPNDNIRRYFQKLHENNVSLSVDFSNKFKGGSMEPVLKSGLYAEYRNRDYTPREFIYRYDNLGYEERQTYLVLPFREMLSDRYLGADKVYIDEVARKSNAYSANVIHAAAYAAVEIPLGRLNIYAGARVENHRIDMTRDKADAASVILKTTKTTNDTDLLPSVNITYKFNEKHQLRASYGRSLNRPELRELSPTIYYDFDLFSEIGGNENLKTAYIDNVDLRYEFYPRAGQTISLGVFYKHFKNPIEWTFIDMGGSLRYMYENADKATAWGLELDVRKNLDFMGMENLSLVMNAALIKSNVIFSAGDVVTEPDRPMQGQSPYIINSGLFYQSERLGLGISLLYNRIGKRIVGLGKSNSPEPNINSMIPDSYEMPRDRLDFNISKPIGKSFEVRCSVRDILSQDIVYKQFPKFEKGGTIHEREQTTRRYNPGQSVTLGVSFKFQ